MTEMIDKHETMYKIATLGRIASSDAQKALLCRVLYIIEHLDSIEITKCCDCMLCANGVCGLNTYSVSPDDFCSGGIPRMESV